MKRAAVYCAVPVVRLLAFCLFWCVSAAYADTSLSGTYSVTLEGAGDSSLVLGQIEMTGDRYELELEDSLFTNHFLSMRPFRCFDREKVMWCYLPYPYDKPKTISPDDLRSLEYDVLFIHRGANDYGIDAWNGLYFKMSQQETGNGSVEVVGELREVDLNILASPPENGIVWPITEDDLHVDESDRHIFNKIRIARKGLK